MAKAIKVLDAKNVRSHMPMKTHKWLDMRTFKPRFSVMARLKPYQWGHICNGTEVVFYDTEEAALIEIQRLKNL